VFVTFSQDRGVDFVEVPGVVDVDFVGAYSDYRTLRVLSIATARWPMYVAI
jgi:galactokinase